MKHIAALTICLISLYAASLCAQETFTDYFGSQDNDTGRNGTIQVANANVRYGPDKNNYRIVVTLHKGDTVTIYGEKDGWYEINFPTVGQVWVNTEYVDLMGNTGTITGDRVTLRADSRYNGLAIGYIDKGAKVQVTSKRGEWYRIVPPDHLRAYIFAELVTPEEKTVTDTREYFRGKMSEVLSKTGWHKTPEGKHLQELDEQLWTYKAGIRFNKATIENLNKTYSDINDIKEEIKKLLKNESEKIQREAEIVLNKAENIQRYITAIITFKKNYMLVEETYKKNIEKLTDDSEKDVLFAGYIDDVGRFIGRETPYVIKKGDEIRAYVTSDIYDLSELYYTEVVVTDYTIAKKSGSYPLIHIKEMDIKGEQTWKNIR